MNKRNITGYNWRNTLSDYAGISGVLAGFCVTFIALILTLPVANTKIVGFDSLHFSITFGQTGVLFFGLSTALFISAAEYFLNAKNYDVYTIPDLYTDNLKKDCKKNGITWDKFVDEQIDSCRSNETLGKIYYNIALIIIFIGLFFVIFPYNLVVAIIVSGFGLAIEGWQFKI